LPVALLGVDSTPAGPVAVALPLPVLPALPVPPELQPGSTKTIISAPATINDLKHLAGMRALPDIDNDPCSRPNRRFVRPKLRGF
jgi:hypothetical protein